MSIEKTEAVVLRVTNYRDTSRIATFYTKRYGKMSAIVKGARNPKKKFGSLIQPLNYIQIVFYRRENRDLQYVSSSDFIKYFKSIPSEVLRLSIGMSLLEIINGVMHDEEENQPVFNLLVDSLTSLDEPASHPQNVFVHFGVHLADNLGFKPNLETCVVCGHVVDLEKVGRVCYVVTKGGPICDKCSGRLASVDDEFMLSVPALSFLQSFVRLDSLSAAKMRIEQQLQNELSNFIFVYLRKHSESLKEIKSLKFMNAALSPLAERARAQVNRRSYDT